MSQGGNLKCATCGKEEEFMYKLHGEFICEECLTKEQEKRDGDKFTSSRK